MNYWGIHCTNPLILLIATLWSFKFVQGDLLEEACEDDSLATHFCPLRPGSSSRLDRDLTLAYDVCESEILPICVTAPRPSPKTGVATIKPGRIKLPITSTSTIPTTRTTSTPLPRTSTESNEVEECEESRSRCDMSTEWLTSKTTVDLKMALRRRRPSSTEAPSTEAPPTEAPAASERSECEDEESRSQCDMSTEWLTSKTTVDLKMALRRRRPSSTEAPSTEAPPTEAPAASERSECEDEESRSQCDMSTEWLTSKTTVDLKMALRRRRPSSTEAPSTEAPPTEAPAASERSECEDEESRSQCDMSTEWLTSKTTVDLRMSLRKRRPSSTEAPSTEAPSKEATVASEGSECEDEEMSKNQCDTSTEWLTSKTTVDLRMSLRKRRPSFTEAASTEAPSKEATVASEGLECEDEEMSTKQCDMSTKWRTSKTTILLRVKPKATTLTPQAELSSPTASPQVSEEEVTTPTPGPQPKGTTAKKVASGTNETESTFTEIHDVFKNYPIFNPHFSTTKEQRFQDSFKRKSTNGETFQDGRIGNRFDSSPEQLRTRMSELNSWKSRKMLADVWKAEERFAALAQQRLTALAQRRTKLEHSYSERKQKEERHLAKDWKQRHNAGMKFEWDYFHPM